MFQAKITEINRDFNRRPEPSVNRNFSKIKKLQKLFSKFFSIFFSKHFFYEHFFLQIFFWWKFFLSNFFWRKFIFSPKYFFCIWCLRNNVFCEIFYSKFCLLRIFCFAILLYGKKIVNFFRNFFFSDEREY